MKDFLSLVVCALLLTACGKEQDTNTQLNQVSRGVIEGQKLFSTEAKEFGPLLKLTFTSPDGYTFNCSAVHIGKGWILTANHCLALPLARDRRMPYLSVNVYARRMTIGPLPATHYKAYVPKATSKRPLTQEGVTYNLQNPDLTAIKLEGQYGASLALSPKVIVPKEELKKEDESKLRIAGFGETKPGRKDFGTLYTGNVFLWNRTDDFFELSQLDSNNKRYAAALPGDSGGPLFARNVQNEMVLYGIFSTYNTLTMVGGITTTDNTYVRTEKGAGAEWLKLLLERI